MSFQSKKPGGVVVFIGLSAVLVIVVILFLVQRTSDVQESIDIEDDIEALEVESEGEGADERDVGQAAVSDPDFTGTRIAGQTAPFLEFNETDYQKAVAARKKIVLLFFADWCPTCQDEIRNAVIPAVNQLTYDNLVIFQVHIEDKKTGDLEKMLQREFQVLGRHVKLFVDPVTGTIEKSAPENWTTEQYIDAINNFILSQRI